MHIWLDERLMNEITRAPGFKAELSYQLAKKVATTLRGGTMLTLFDVSDDLGDEMRVGSYSGESNVYVYIPPRAKPNALAGGRSVYLNVTQAEKLGSALIAWAGRQPTKTPTQLWEGDL